MWSLILEAILIANLYIYGVEQLATVPEVPIKGRAVGHNYPDAGAYDGVSAGGAICPTGKRTMVASSTMS
jgi:hypothetical protein